MKQYFIKSPWMDDERLNVPSLTVIERDSGWQKSGLLDQHGNELMFREGIEPIGFLTEFFGKN
jgi:hypothetical protein